MLSDLEILDVILPFKKFDNLVAVFACPFVPAVIFAIAVLFRVQNDIPSDESIEQALVKIAMGELGEMLCHLLLIEREVIDGVLKNLCHLVLFGFAGLGIGNEVTDETSQVLFLCETADEDFKTGRMNERMAAEALMVKLCKLGG